LRRADPGPAAPADCRGAPGVAEQAIPEAYRDPLKALAVEVKTVQRAVLTQLTCGVHDLAQFQEMHARPIGGERPELRVERLDLPRTRHLQVRHVGSDPLAVAALVHGQHRQEPDVRAGRPRDKRRHDPGILPNDLCARKAFAEVIAAAGDHDMARAARDDLPQPRENRMGVVSNDRPVPGARVTEKLVPRSALQQVVTDHDDIAGADG